MQRTVLPLILLVTSLCFISCELDPDFDPGGTVGSNVEAKFSVTKQTEPDCYAPCTVDFANTSTGATQYTWGFGDGMTSNEASPSHEFDLGGEYVVTLTARNAAGDENVEIINVSIETPITFKKTFGDVNEQWGNTVILTEDGGYAIAGWEKVSGDLDGYLLRIDEDGNVVFGFPKKYDGIDKDYELNGIDQTDDEGFILTGRSGNLLLLLRTDAVGNAVGSFPREYNDPGQAIPGISGMAVKQLPDGGFAALGSSWNYRGGSGQRDIIYVRTNPGGDAVDFAFFTSDPDYSDEIVGNWVFDGVDEFLAVGGSQESIQDEFFVVKFDLAGNVVNTSVTFGGGNDDVLTSVCINPQGGYAATGYTESSGNGLSDVFFVKLNTNGTPVISSQETFGGTSEDFGSAIQATSDGGFVIIGYTTSFGLGGSDFYLLKLDNSGVLEYPAITFGGFSADSALDIKETSDRGFIIVGVTESFGNGGADIYVIKTDAKGRVL